MKLSTMTFAMCFALAPFAAHASFGGMRLGGGTGGGMGGMHGGGMGATSAGMNNLVGQMTPSGGGIRHRGAQCSHGRLRLKSSPVAPLLSWLSPHGAKC